MRNSETVKAEIIWVLKCVASGYSNNPCCDLQEIFSAMFTDSYIAIAIGAYKIIFIGTCGLHVIHGPFKAGEESRDWTWSIQGWCRINRLENENDLKSNLSNPP